jgi:hypothetical protein
MVLPSSAQAQAQLEAELALFSFDPAPHPPPPTHPRESLLGSLFESSSNQLQSWASLVASLI